MHLQDDKEQLLGKFRARLEKPGLVVPPEAQTAIDDEMEKLALLEKNSPEFNVTKNYLDWLTSLPWGMTTAENFDVSKAREVLDADHFGLQEVKDRILEFIAVGKMRGSIQGKILCLVGPPGVGKVSQRLEVYL
jgi:Lon-like ATP-dependent protease